MTEVLCAVCRKGFVPSRKNHICCCKDCSYKHWFSKNLAVNRAKKAALSRAYGYKTYGYSPKPSKEILCPSCDTIFLPATNRQRCCTTRCSERLRYKENPEKYRALSIGKRKKHLARIRAKGRTTWAKMREERGTDSPYAKSRYPWLPLFTGARHRALKNNLPFDLTREWCDTRWDGRCELTGIEFVLNSEQRTGFSPSIDKKDPAQGYTQSNCRFILWALNLFKFTGTDADMLNIAETLIARSPQNIAGILALPG